MAMMGAGLFMLALIPLNDSILLVEAAMLVIGCGLGLNTGPVNAVAVANAPRRAPAPRPVSSAPRA
jgi:hypothetical protein